MKRRTASPLTSDASFGWPLGAMNEGCPAVRQPETRDEDIGQESLA